MKLHPSQLINSYYPQVANQDYKFMFFIQVRNTSVRPRFRSFNSQTISQRVSKTGLTHPPRGGRISCRLDAIASVRAETVHWTVCKTPSGPRSAAALTSVSRCTPDTVSNITHRPGAPPVRGSNAPPERLPGYARTAALPNVHRSVYSLCTGCARMSQAIFLLQGSCRTVPTRGPIPATSTKNPDAKFTASANFSS